jgi:hypothetical protein
MKYATELPTELNSQNFLNMKKLLHRKRGKDSEIGILMDR